MLFWKLFFLFIILDAELFNYIVLFSLFYGSTTHNWQKLKSTFLTCPFHKIYRVEAVDLKSSNYIYKIKIFVKM